MTGDGIGQVLDVKELGGSRREVLLAASDYGQIYATLEPGVLGSDQGPEILARMANRRALAYSQARPKPRRKVEG